MQTVTAYVIVEDAGAFIDFVKALFDAEEVARVANTGGGTHAEVRIGDTMVMIGGGAPHPPVPAPLHVYVDDVEAAHRRALSLGARELMPPGDRDYGDRDSAVADPFGNHWYLAAPLGGGKPAAPLRSVNLYFHPAGAARLADYLVVAFDAEVLDRHASPDGVLHHAKVLIGDTVVELGEAHGDFPPMPPCIFLWVDDADRVYARAIAAGGKSLREPADAPWGARTSTVEDFAGNQWFVTGPLRPQP
jgi:uncharacterized glyoxalase superfamily protein PhnB